MPKKDELDQIIDDAIELSPSEYSWAVDNDERRRCFVFDHMHDMELGSFVSKDKVGDLIKQMDKMVNWLRTGATESFAMRTFEGSKR